MTAAHPPTLPGNPYGLTIDQHVLPRRSIARFANNGFVQVKKLDYGTVRLLHPKHETFCAKRVWDQKAETIGSQTIEKAFQGIADAVVQGHRAFTEQQNAEISEMYFLWRARFQALQQGRDDIPIVLKDSHEAVSQDRHEYLERAGVISFLPGGLLPRRMLNGVNLRRSIDIDMINAGQIAWGVITAKDGQFLVPDTARGWLLMPIAPKLYLAGNSPNRDLDYLDVAAVNSVLRDQASKYYFSNDLKACPLKRQVTKFSWDTFFNS